MLKENNILFEYQGYDESMKPEEVLDKNLAIYMNNDADALRHDEYFEPDPYRYSSYTETDINMIYSEIPDYEGMRYIPPLFREEFEISIWKIDTQNHLKIKNSYFTPTVRVLNSHFYEPISFESFGGFIKNFLRCKKILLVDMKFFPLIF